MKQLKKERKFIVFANFCTLLLLILSVSTNNFDNAIFFAMIQIIIIIAYFDNKKGIKQYEKMQSRFFKEIKSNSAHQRE